MRTMAHEIWLDAGNNPSLHVNIVPGQGDTKSPGWAPGVAMTTSLMSPIRL